MGSPSPHWPGSESGGERWALWTAVGSYLLGLAVALPIHYVYGLAMLGHVGPFYLVTLAVLAGTWLTYTGMARKTEDP
jgi:hypothetical protein